MREIRINCPHCHRKSKLFLTSRPYLMVLNCPVCHHSLLNSEGKTYDLLVNTQHSPSTHKKEEPVRTAPVSRDDIVDLKIALESCRDVSDFLKMI